MQQCAKQAVYSTATASGDSLQRLEHFKLQLQPDISLHVTPQHVSGCTAYIPSCCRAAPGGAAS